MLDSIKSYFYKKDFYIIITDKDLSIKKYKKVEYIDDNKIIIIINKDKYIITGKDFKVIKCGDNEIVVSGYVESIKNDN